MDLPIRSPFHLLIIVLLIVFGGFLAFGFAFGSLATDRTRRQSNTTRLPQAAVLAVCALIWWLFAARSTSIETFARCVFLGMALSFASNVVMAGLLRIENRVLWNMVIGGAGCIFYILALRELQILFDLGDKSTLVLMLVVGWVVSVGVWMGLIVVSEGGPATNTGTLIYGLLLGSMAAYAGALAVQMPGLMPVAAGAGLNFIANMLWGNHTLRNNNWYLVSDVAWITYIFGQALIVFTTATVLTIAP
ncbi:MAG: hypothetical protein JXB47_10995 [Anaerolineae bacterium]|nr:hypothetical protein [Anaerolineae bacterium]